MNKHQRESYTFGQKIADNVAHFGGSWGFIIVSICAMIMWIITNVFQLFNMHFDPYPFILLNLFLSMVAALQAPLILMSQNRSSDYDRLHADNDYHVNLKTEEEMRVLHAKIDIICYFLAKCIGFSLMLIHIDNFKTFICQYVR